MPCPAGSRGRYQKLELVALSPFGHSVAWVGWDAPHCCPSLHPVSPVHSGGAVRTCQHQGCLGVCADPPAMLKQLAEPPLDPEQLRR